MPDRTWCSSPCSSKQLDLKTTSDPDATAICRSISGTWLGLIVGGGMKASKETGRSQTDAT